MTKNLNVTPKTTLRSGKSEAYSNDNKRIRISYYYFLLRVTTDGHKASRGFSATSELLATSVKHFSQSLLRVLQETKRLDLDMSGEKYNDLASSARGRLTFAGVLAARRVSR